MVPSAELGALYRYWQWGVQCLSNPWGQWAAFANGEKWDYGSCERPDPTSCNVKATTEISLLVILFDVRMSPLQIQKENLSYPSFVIIHPSLPNSNSCRQCNFGVDWNSFGGSSLMIFPSISSAGPISLWIGYDNGLTWSKTK